MQSAKKNPRLKFGSNEIALAIELREWGASWRNIEKGLGKGIHNAVWRATCGNDAGGYYAKQKRELLAGFA